MKTRSTPRLSRARAAALREALDRLTAGMDVAGRLASDPLHFARRYADPGDAEIAAVFAATLAYGRVAAFWPVLTALFAAFDARGGPRAFAVGFGPPDAAALAPLQYRWNRGADFALLAATLGAAIRRRGRLGALFESAFDAGDGTVAAALDAAVGELRALAVAEAPALGLPGADFEALPRGFRAMLPRPADGSACKRWNMLLRWMARPPGPVGAGGLPARVDGADLGLWRLPTAALVVPLDTHVQRISWFIGLTDRRDGSWRTAEEITGALARLDPGDPTRFDFALAHLGISGACQGRRVPDVCGGCALLPVCVVGSPDRARPTG